MSAVLLFAGNASAVPVTYTCTDTAGTGSGGANASSSITTAGATEAASVSTSNCGPWLGNDSNALTAAAGGYGFDLFDSVSAPDGWLELDKADGGDGTLITGTGWGGTSGTFSFADAGYDDYLIALKFDGVYSTFLSDSWADNWSWNTDPDGDNKFAISHLTVYVRNPSQEVPEPAIVGLLSIGLLGMVVTRRRMKV